MICVVGFNGQTAHSQATKHRAVRRQRSLLSESIRTTPGFEHSRGFSSRGSLDSQASWSSIESVEDSEPASPRSFEEEASLSCSSGLNSSTAPLMINYSRAARARIDAAEAKGKQRDEQLEMLHAVRQYMAQSKLQSARAAAV